MKKTELVGFTIVEVLIIGVISGLMGAAILNHIKEPSIEDWYPRLMWKDYKKEIHVKGNIESVFVQHEILYVVADKKAIYYGTLKVK
jgi:hypothetical protein